ncbi:MAG TPA: hypothetical protein DDZ24_03800, partial [Planctomycetaceae bacterium]|nr:hypothetical protein [Planctomycetaceae bacterium]
MTGGRIRFRYKENTMQQTAPSTDTIRHSSRITLIGILALVALYVVSAYFGIPQRGRDLLVASHAAHDDHNSSNAEYPPTNDGEYANNSGIHPEEHVQNHRALTETRTPPPAWAVTPFVLLLGAIAILPLIPSLAHWWEKNSSKLLMAGILGGFTLAYYLFIHSESVEQHFPAHFIVAPPTSGLSWAITGTVLANALLAEYVPFITLLFALYAITGGVRIEGDVQATPTANTTILALGALLASFIGTTGAAMLLIRPLLETNQQRKRVVHTLVFFIFLVCNCGGCLLPIGDPPLFLGYLQGVPFLWTFSLWQEWLTVNVALLAIYWTWDHFFAYPSERLIDIVSDKSTVRPLRVTGLPLNLPLMAGVIFAVALLDPSKAIPGTDWHPWIFLREIVLLSLVGCSLWFGSITIRVQNGFSYFAILEVAALFVGIFVCMQPALSILNEHGASLGIRSPTAFFWTTGALSSVLDNAPTYLVFFKTAQS